MIHLIITGERINNLKFSECSENSIAKVLKTKSHCFEAPVIPNCGNGLVEGFY